MTHPFGLLRQRNIILQYYVEHSMFIIGQIKCSWLLPHRQAICFSSLIWLSRNKSVKKSRFSRIVKNSREFSLLDLDLEAFWFHFSLLEKEWKHFDFTLHFSKKSESIFFSLCTSRKRVKAFYFHFSLLELQKPTLAGPCPPPHFQKIMLQILYDRCGCIYARKYDGQIVCGCACANSTSKSRISASFGTTFGGQRGHQRL
jgi:hypothetical protein